MTKEKIVNAYRLQRVRIALMVLAWGLLTAATCQGGTDTMNLTVSLTLPKTTILYQEDLACLLVLENRGTSPVKIISPLMAHSWPVIRLINLNTGKKSLHETERHPQDMSAPPPWTELGPGQQSALSFQLKEKVLDLVPGEYEISVIYDYNQGEQTAESAPVRIEVTPSTPHHLFLASANGRASNAWYGAWINLAPGRPQVVWGCLDLINGGGVRTVSVVDPAGVRSEPVLSEPASGNMAPGQWLAWTDQDQLSFTYLIPGSPPGAPGKVPLNNRAARIVGPLHDAMPGKDQPGVPRGEALILLDSHPHVHFQSLSLTGTMARSGGTAMVPGGRMPAWIRSVFPARGQQMAPYILSEPGKTDLYLLPWGENTAMTSRALSSWDGDFLAACCTLDDRDLLHGAVLVWTGKAEDTKTLDIIPWTLGPDGQFAEQGPRAVEWEFTESIIQADMAVNPKGQAVAVVRRDTGLWNFIGPDGKVSPLAGDFLKTDQTLTLGFLHMINPVLIGGTPSLGLKITGPDGSPIPPPPGY